MNDTTDRPDRPHSQTEPIVIEARKARAGIITGRVLTVLIVSLTLAFIAMVILLAIYWGGERRSVLNAEVPRLAGAPHHGQWMG